uniref:Uncharacterized protein n=1 Tax=Leersia perrieri TaxID=77586 RepID=A0A0D9VD49_9ORYZ
MGFRSSLAARLALLAVAAVVVVLLLCTAVESSRTLHDHAGGSGFSAGQLPVFAVARAGPSQRGPGH